jgi:hypothetical protein
MAYYSSKGVVIKEGAAGLGAVSMALDYSTYGAPPPVHARRDGSLGQYEQAAAGLGYPLFVDGQPVDRPMSFYHGPAPVPPGRVFPSLPTFPTERAAAILAERDMALPEETAAAIAEAEEAARIAAEAETGMDTAEAAQPVMGFGQDLARMAFPRGIPKFRFRHGMRGLGQAANGRLDLTDPAAVTELKSALSLAMPELTLTSAGQSTYTERWYQDSVWGPSASDLFAAFVAKITASGSPYTESDLAVMASGGTYPTVEGVMAILAMGVGSPGYGTDPTYFQSNFPILHAFAQKVVAAGGDTASFSVAAPYFSEAERVKGKGILGMSTMAFIGLGAVAAVGAYLVFRKK